jgi:hypothetical protein
MSEGKYGGEKTHNKKKRRTFFEERKIGISADDVGVHVVTQDVLVVPRG